MGFRRFGWVGCQVNLRRQDSTEVASVELDVYLDEEKSTGSHFMPPSNTIWKRFVTLLATLDLLSSFFYSLPTKIT